MNLVNELQVSAEKQDVLTVLRTARRLASKLCVSDIDTWLKAEQNGYPRGHEIPNYRIVKGSMVFNSNGPVPIGWGMVGKGVMDYPGGIIVNYPMPDSIGELISLINTVEETGHGLFMQVEDDGRFDRLRDRLNPLIAERVTFMLKMNRAQVQAIPEAVKDRILDWACELERRGVCGENMSFNETERKLANDITFNVTGDNYNVSNNSAPVAMSAGDTVQTEGTKNTVKVASKERSSLVVKMLEWIRTCWQWLFGKPA